MDARTPSTAAYSLTKILRAFSDAHGVPRFPIDVSALALETARLFQWADPITEVKAAAIPSFEGALFADNDRHRWMLLYNDELRSEGRIRFTQAHELGHYILHRQSRERFECSAQDMIDITGNERTIESQADSFASTLLMPLDDFRAQVYGAASLEAISAAAERYGVSLTAAALRWIHHTDACAILVVHCDGFMRWASSSKSAYQGGAFFRSRREIVPIPALSIAADEAVEREMTGREVPARVWFPSAPKDLSLREMKLTSREFEFTMTLLVLPRGTRLRRNNAERDLGAVADIAERARDRASLDPLDGDLD